MTNRVVSGLRRLRENILGVFKTLKPQQEHTTVEPLSCTGLTQEPTFQGKSSTVSPDWCDSCNRHRKYCGGPPCLSEHRWPRNCYVCNDEVMPWEQYACFRKLGEKQSTIRCEECCKKAEANLKGDPICDDKAMAEYRKGQVRDVDALVEVFKGTMHGNGPNPQNIQRGTPDVITSDGKIMDYKTECPCGWVIQPADWHAAWRMANGITVKLCGPCGQAKSKELAEASVEMAYKVEPTGERGLNNIKDQLVDQLVLEWQRGDKTLKPFYEMNDTEIRENLRITDGPNVTLIATTAYLDGPIEKFLRDRGIDYETDAEAEADALAEFAGRMCYWSFPEHLRRVAGDGQNVAYLDHIREVGHGSVTEHSYFTFVVDDLSKNTTQELVRHRVGVAYSIQSSRYVDQFSNEYFGNSGHSLGVYIPSEVSGCRDLLQAWFDAWIICIRTYKRTFDNLRARGIAKKDARSAARHILPGGMCNAVVFTVNCRELNHIFNLRGNFGAEREIRMMALALHDQVKHMNVFRHWERRSDPVKGDYLHNTDKDKPLFKTMEDGLRYLNEQFDGYTISCHKYRIVEGHDDMEIPDTTPDELFRKMAEREAEFNISVPYSAENGYCEDTNQHMVSQEEFEKMQERNHTDFA